MDGLALLQGCTQSPVQTILQVELAAPRHDMGEEITVEGGVVLEQAAQVQGALRGDELVETHLDGWDLGPLFLHIPVVGVGAGVADSFEDHAAILPGGAQMQQSISAVCPPIQSWIGLDGALDGDGSVLDRDLIQLRTQ